MNFGNIKNLIKAYLKFNFNKRLHYSDNNNAIIVKSGDYRIYKRYYYTFIKFFALSGYSIYFPDVDFKHYRFNIYNKKPNLYRLLFEDNIVIYSKPPKRAKIHLTITDKLLSPDYFSTLPSKKMEELSDTYHVPMAMHPLLYKKNLWNVSIDSKRTKKKSIFMVGNIFHLAYSNIKNPPFEMESRTDTYNFLKEKGMLKNINSNKELLSFISSNDDKKCIILNSELVPIDVSILRSTINNFRFYLALPGVHMPLSHNLIEAMSTSAIPILSKNYNHFLAPQLTHMKNAIIYNSLEELEELIKIVYEIDDEKLDQMSKNVLEYYKSNLTPTAIVNKIISNNFKTIYLQAEQSSVEILRDSLYTIR